MKPETKKLLKFTQVMNIHYKRGFRDGMITMFIIALMYILMFKP